MQLLRLSRWCTAGWGVALIAIAFIARGWGSVFTTGLTIASLVYGPMLGTFLLALLTRSGTETGALAGITVSLAAMLLVRLFTPLAWTWYVLVGTAIAFTVGYAVVASGRTEVRPYDWQTQAHFSCAVHTLTVSTPFANALANCVRFLGAGPLTTTPAVV